MVNSFWSWILGLEGHIDYSKLPRNLLIDSLLVLLIGFIGPVFFQLFPGIVTLIPGPWLRMIPPGLASLLAFAGLLAYFRPGQRRQ